MLMKTLSTIAVVLLFFPINNSRAFMAKAKKITTPTTVLKDGGATCLAR